MTTEEFLEGLNERIDAMRTALEQMIKLRDSLTNLPTECEQLMNTHLTVPKQLPEMAIEVKSNELAGMTIAEAACAVLKECIAPMHFEEVARRAVSRGYVGRKAVFSTIKTSFWATLNRTTELFEPVGCGKYRLKQAIYPANN